MGLLWESFDSRLQITGKLEAKAGLRIGQGGQAADPAASDLPILKLPDGTLFIPGSSLRGVWRSQVERVVRAFEAVGPGKGACDPTGKTCIEAASPKEFREKFGKGRELKGREFAAAVFEESCRVCRVFGSTWLASRVRFSDLPCNNGAKVEVRDGVSINREKETVQEKFDFETVTPGSAFRLEVLADNLDKMERGLLCLGLEELRRGRLAIGGFKGRGLGVVGLEEDTLELVEGPKALRQYLLTKTMAGVNPAEIQDWINMVVADLAKEGG